MSGWTSVLMPTWDDAMNSSIMPSLFLMPTQSIFWARGSEEM